VFARRRVLIVGVSALCAAFVLWLKYSLGGAFVSLAVDDLGEMAAALAAAGACLWAARRRHPRTRRYWTLLGLSALTWAIGEGVWSYYEVFQGREVPFPSLADLGFLAAVPLAVAAILSYPTAPIHSTTRLRAITDALSGGASLLFISWELVLGPIFRAHEGGAFSQVLSIAYPLSDIVVAAVVLMVAVQAGRGARSALGLVGIGLLAMAIADSAFAYLSQQSSFGDGTLLDAGWFGGYLLIAVAALWPEVDTARADDDGKDYLGRGWMWVPYFPVITALLFAVLLEVEGHRFGPFLESTGIAIVLLLVIRQMLTLADNMRLTHHLEERVIERTEQLRANEQRFAALVQNASDVVTIIDREGILTYLSPSTERVFGGESANMIGREFRELLSPADGARWSGVIAKAMNEPRGNLSIDWEFQHPASGGRHIESLITNLLDDPAVRGIVINSRDVTERAELQEQLRHQAFHDPLTGLANRALFQDRLSHALARHRRTDNPLAVIFLDIDNFKAINDGRGHSVGDLLLRQVGERLQTAVRAADTVARLGGDEFAVLLEPRGTAPSDVADRILQAMRQPFSVADAELFVNASLGIAQTDSGHETAEELLRNADVAMYVAKGRGKARWVQFDSSMHDIVLTRLALESDIRRGFDNREFTAHYQPLISLADGRIVGFEALARWHHPTRGLVMPDDFIPAAESTGIIVPLGYWLLDKACHDIKSWQRRLNRPDLALSVNLSGRQLEDPDIVDKVHRALATSELEPALLTLELTESVLIEPTDELVATLNALKANGVRLAIDDFGTGYSSLSYLSRLPVDELKIDRSFIGAIDAEHPESSGLIRKILSLAEELGLTTVAEGIEDPVQLGEVREGGCDIGQGFLFAEAVPTSDLAELMAAAEAQTRLVS
jgi:diguanylate cyclase (GGDEF)-like protein/PAS domain S-box-containing protein